MAAGKKKIELFVEIHNEKDFMNIIKINSNQLICAEIYNYSFGFCTALDRLFTKIKLDWSDGKMLLLKVPADEIATLQRFKEQSEPVYLFILNMKVTKVFRGVDMIKLGEVAKKELEYYRDEQNGLEVDREFYELNEPTADEYEWITATALEKKREEENALSRHIARLAARKRHRAELMVPHLTDLNFIIYWPHSLHAHPELYEQWDNNSIVMIGRELVNVTENMVADIFYEGDAPLNEASLHTLYSGPALALCLRLLNSDKSFTALVRKILYEDTRPVTNDDTKEISPTMTAFDYYKSYSPTKDEILLKRQEEKVLKREQLNEKRCRRLSVMQRLARQAIAEALEAKKAEREKHKLELLKAGNLLELERFNEEPEDDTVDIVVPEELPDEEEVCSEMEEDPGEYFPPPGLLIPGFYAPSNDIGKVNGLAFLFPKLVHDRVMPQPEFLPPHVLVMLDIQKRYKAINAVKPYKNAILHMGIFKATSPFDSIHMSYTVKQFDTLLDMNSLNLDEIKIAFMVSLDSDIALLQLVDLTPWHISRDEIIGEEESAAMFPVDYCDDYDQFEDF